MNRYQRQIKILIPVEVDESDLVTIAQATQILGIGYTGVNAALQRGRYTCVIDTHSFSQIQQHKYLIRAELEDGQRVTLPRSDDPSAQFQVEERVLEDLPEIDTTDLINIAQAARDLGITSQGVVNAMERGAFTYVVDTQARSRQQFRRLLLRKEVDRLDRQR